jgi:hypothetical protein
MALDTPRESRNYAPTLAAGKFLVFGGEVPGTGETVDIRPPRQTWLEEAMSSMFDTNPGTRSTSIGPCRS